MTTTHTPGPWSVVSSTRRGTYSQPVRGNPQAYRVEGPRPAAHYATPVIAHVSPVLGQTEPNARLIAAAPELLAALRKFAACRIYLPLGETPEAVMLRDALTFMDAAIARAEREL